MEITKERHTRNAIAHSANEAVAEAIRDVASAS